MTKITLADNAYITMECIPEKKMIRHVIHKPIERRLDLLQDALNAGTDALIQHQCNKWLSDDRKNGPLPEEQIEWATGDWSPRTIQAGWKYWANVVPEELVAAGALTPLIEDLHQYGLKMRVFTAVEAAEAWLESV